jgi:hypothetical protein
MLSVQQESGRGFLPFHGSGNLKVFQQQVQLPGSFLTELGKFSGLRLNPEGYRPPGLQEVQYVLKGGCLGCCGTAKQ